ISHHCGRSSTSPREDVDRPGIRNSTTSVETLTLHSVIPERRVSGESGISRLWSGIPGSPFGRPGMTPRESSVSIGTLDLLPAAALGRAKQGVDHPHIADRDVDAVFDPGAGADGPRECFALQVILIDDGERG